jgi:hypothetical protein
VPVAVLFLGIVADPEEIHAVWHGMLNTLGIFDVSKLTDAENVTYLQKKFYFWFGEVGLANILAGSIAVPAGIWLAGQPDVFPRKSKGPLTFFPILEICIPVLL